MVQNEEMARRKPGWVHEITRLVLGTPSRRKGPGEPGDW